jgi:hypothetical protein
VASQDFTENILKLEDGYVALLDDGSTFVSVVLPRPRMTRTAASRLPIGCENSQTTSPLTASRGNPRASRHAATARLLGCHTKPIGASMLPSRKIAQQQGAPRQSASWH